MANEVAFYGTFVAVAGIAADNIAARNAGAGAASLGAIVGGHYRFEEQRATFARAAARTQCVQEAFAPIDSEATRRLFPADFGNNDVRDAYDAIPARTVGVVAAIGRELDSALDGIALTAPTLDDLNKLVAASNEAANRTQEANKNLAPSPATQARLRGKELALAGAEAGMKGSQDKAKAGRLLPAALLAAMAAGRADKEQLQQELAKLAADAAAEEDRKRVFQAAVIGFAKNVDNCLVLIEP